MTISAANSIFQYLFAAKIGFFAANQQVSPCFAARIVVFAAKLFYDQMARHETGSLSGQTKGRHETGSLPGQAKCELFRAASRDRLRTNFSGQPLGTDTVRLPGQTYGRFRFFNASRKVVLPRDNRLTSPRHSTYW